MPGRSRQKKTKKSLLGPDFRKAQPKLRVVANGSTEVNAMRAEQCGAVMIAEGDEMLKQVEAAAQTVIETALPQDANKSTVKARKGKLNKLPSNVKVNIFIQTNTSFSPPGTVKGTGMVTSSETARSRNLVTATVPVSELPELLVKNNVSYVELAENLKVPKPVVTNDKPPKPKEGDRRISNRLKHDFGKKVLVGIIDIGGFDFSHPDFLDKNGNTRFVSIWDQGSDTRLSPYERRQKLKTNVQQSLDPRKKNFTEREIEETFNYGAEITSEHMNRALKAAKDLGVAPYRLEPQSSMVPGSHGTHVASIAAGNHGVARDASIVAVLLSLPDEGTDESGRKLDDRERRRSSFYDSSRLAHAVDYLMAIADGTPISINISLGTNGHAHDGTSPVCRWIDAWLSQTGVSVTAAAGNAGQEKGLTADDHGYVMGRIHTSGQIASRGLTADIEWQVIGNGIADMSENELEIWYSSQDHFGVSVKPPGLGWTEIIGPHEYIENRLLPPPEKSLLSIYNERYHPANGMNCISIYLSPYWSKEIKIGSRPGLWRVRLHGIEIRDGRFHGWIERDDPNELGAIGDKRAWFFPSFFSEESNVDNSSVSSLACGQRIISVANLDAAREMINITSSQGPTRDGREKPDIAAPGTNVIAAKGFSDDGEQWIAMSGTSMAAPYVTGLVALMLNIRPRLTAAQIGGIIRSTARPLPGRNYSWGDSAGFGQIDPVACLQQAARVDERKDVTK